MTKSEIEIYQEKFRIDLLVISGKLAIIFENKIYNAADGEAQLSRYIDKVKDILNIQESDIYVLYLSNSGKEPALQSWGNYRERFKDRYLNLSFKDDIREWIKVMDIAPHEKFLSSAVLQYSDYLDGLFNQRELNKEINMELQDIIKKHLELDETKPIEENIKALQTEIANVQDIQKQMEKLLKGYYETIFKEWEEQTKKDYPDLQPNEDRAYRKSICEVSYTFNSSDLVISLTDNGEKLYCQVEIFQKRDNPSQYIITDALKKVLIKDKILDSSNDWAIWKYFEYKEYKEAFDCFKKAILILQRNDDHDNK